MRVLCLHGSGSSAEIFESQIGPLRSKLPAHWEYDFLDAPIECGPDVQLKGIFPGPYYCFFEKYSKENMREAVEYVAEVVEEDGPYDLVIGFSQGASVAAAYLASQHPSSVADSAAGAESIKLAVFCCSALIPPQTANPESLVATIGSFGNINIPTVHVIGKRDLCYNQSVELSKSCDKMSQTIVYHPDGHELPREANYTADAADGIQKALRQALAG